MAIYDPLDDSFPKLFAGLAWPLCGESLSRCRLIIRAFNEVQQKQASEGIDSPAVVGVFEVPEPSDREQQLAFAELGTSLAELQRMQEPADAVDRPSRAAASP